MTRTHLVDCPEIISAIGEQIPLFECSSDNPLLLTFRPRTLLACTQVSKTWREVMLPLIWRVHDTYSARATSLNIWKLYSEHVRELFGNNSMETPIYTQLRTLKLEATFHSKIALKLLLANSQLQSVKLSGISLYQALAQERGRILNQRQQISANEGGNNEVGSDGQVSSGVDDAVVIKPLENCRHVLESLSVTSMRFDGDDLWCLLSPLSKGVLYRLSLCRLTGVTDLKDLVFETVTHVELTFNLDHTQNPGVDGVVGRCPELAHLTLHGGFNRGILENLNRIMNNRVAQPSRDARRESTEQHYRPTRPQLVSLSMSSHPQHTPDQASGGNSPLYLGFVKACSNVFNKNRFGYQGSLRELEITLWVIDDAARVAIEYHRMSLETLKIRVLRSTGYNPSVNFERQGRVVARLLRSCRRLRVFDLLDARKEADVACFMENIMAVKDRDGQSYTSESDSGLGSDDDNDDVIEDKDLSSLSAARRQQRLENRKQPWQSPELESLTVRMMESWTPNPSSTVTERERHHTIVDASGSTHIWIMPQQEWCSDIKDGTDYLLDTRWFSFQLFQEEGDSQEDEQEQSGEDFTRQFLRHIAPSAKLKTLQLGQLTFSR